MSNKKDCPPIVMGGRGGGKTFATIQNLAKSLEEEKRKHQELGKQFNEMVTVHNALVDAHDGLLSFIKMQCGILYTAITGDVKVTDPLKEISVITLADDGAKDLLDYRQGICIYVKTYEETGDPIKAFDAYQDYLGGM